MKEVIPVQDRFRTDEATIEAIAATEVLEVNPRLERHRLLVIMQREMKSA